MANPYRSKASISLGDVVKDVLTRFSGVAIGRTEWLHNCTRWVLQPQDVKDGAPRDTSSFDEPSLVFVKNTTLAVLPVSRPEDHVDIGDEVQDKCTGVKGLAIGWTTWINGCSRITIQPKALKDNGKPADSFTADEKDIKILRRANPKPAKVATGGPRPESRMPSASRGR